MVKILFVCHGNICRSPMAEFVMKDLVNRAGVGDRFEIASAAVSREELGNSIYPPAQRVLQEHGIAFSPRRARLVTSQDLAYYDRIYYMDSRNVSYLRRLFGSLPEKCRSLLSRDVADPYYSGDFTQTWEDIFTGCTRILEEYIYMLNRELLEEGLSQLPLYTYHFMEPQTLEFADRIRWICEHDCPMYGRTWACPPGVGTVAQCEKKCKDFEHCLMISTITEVSDIADIAATLQTRPQHEAVTNQVRDLMRLQNIEPYILSTEACTICQRCAILDGQPCRYPDKMHPCVESHGINLLSVLEELGLNFQYGENVVTWFSLLFY